MAASTAAKPDFSPQLMIERHRRRVDLLHQAEVQRAVDARRNERGRANHAQLQIIREHHDRPTA